MLDSLPPLPGVVRTNSITGTTTTSGSGNRARIEAASPPLPTTPAGINKEAAAMIADVDNDVSPGMRVPVDSAGAAIAEKIMQTDGSNLTRITNKQDASSSEGVRSHVTFAVDTNMSRDVSMFTLSRDARPDSKSPQELGSTTSDRAGVNVPAARSVGGSSDSSKRLRAVNFGTHASTESRQSRTFSEGKIAIRTSFRGSRRKDEDDQSHSDTHAAASEKDGVSKKHFSPQILSPHQSASEHYGSTELFIEPQTRTGKFVERAQIFFGLLEKHDEFVRRYALMHPSAPFLLIWNTVQSIIFLFLALYTPVKVAFEDDMECVDWITQLHVAIDGFFIIDVALGFLTCARVHGRVTDSPAYVANRYISSGWFFFDTICSFPSTWVSIALDMECQGNFAIGKMLLRMMRLARVVRVMKIFRLADFSDNAFVLQLVKLCCAMCVILHISACGWWLVKAQDPDLESFLEGQSIGEGISSKYLSSLYFSVATLTTVGYGDISGGTDMERAFALVSMLTGAGIFASIISSLSSLIASRRSGDQAFLDKMEEVRGFVKFWKLSIPLAERVRDFYRHEKDVRTWNANLALIQELPSDIGEDVCSELAQGLLSKVQLFQSAPLDYMNKIFLNLRPRRVAPKEIIFSEGEPSSELFIISVGEVKLLLPDGSPFHILGDGDVFGDEGVLPGASIRPVSAVAMRHTELYVLEQLDLQRINQSYPEMEALFEDKLEQFYASAHKAARDANRTTRRMDENVVGTAVPVPTAKLKEIQKELSELPPSPMIGDFNLRSNPVDVDNEGGQPMSMRGTAFVRDMANTNTGVGVEGGVPGSIRDMTPGTAFPPGFPTVVVRSQLDPIQSGNGMGDNTPMPDDMPYNNAGINSTDRVTVYDLPMLPSGGQRADQLPPGFGTPIISRRGSGGSSNEKTARLYSEGVTDGSSGTSGGGVMRTRSDSDYETNFQLPNVDSNVSNPQLETRLKTMNNAFDNPPAPALSSEQSGSAADDSYIPTVASSGVSSAEARGPHAGSDGSGGTMNSRTSERLAFHRVSPMANKRKTKHFEGGTIGDLVGDRNPNGRGSGLGIHPTKPVKLGVPLLEQIGHRDGSGNLKIGDATAAQASYTHGHGQAPVRRIMSLVRNENSPAHVHVDSPANTLIMGTGASAGGGDGVSPGTIQDLVGELSRLHRVVELQSQQTADLLRIHSLNSRGDNVVVDVPPRDD